MEDSISVIISGSAAHSASHLSAQDFISAVYASAKKINYIFFYADATEVAKKFDVSSCEVGKLEIQRISENWLKLSNQFNIPLYACISAALKRGIVDADQPATISEDPQPAPVSVNLKPAFQLEGLSRIAETVAANGKIIEFGR